MVKATAKSFASPFVKRGWGDFQRDAGPNFAPVLASVTLSLSKGDTSY